MPYYFAWVAPGTAFNPVVHNVTDEEIFAFNLTQQEGEFAQLEIELVNPRIGLLAGTRQQWCWFSYDDGSTITPMFFGRIIGMPQDMADDLVKLVFIARPEGFDTIKNNFSETLKVFPFWDPMFMDKGDAEEDPDTVLEARPELFHIDRITHALTTSNIALGEAGELDFSMTAFYDSVKVSTQSTPGRLAKVTAEVSWEQKARGDIDITGRFPAVIKTYTGEGLLGDWPQSGAKIGKDWSVKSSKAEIIEGGLRANFKQARQEFSLSSRANVITFPVFFIKPSMVVQYDVARSYTERLNINLEANVQPMLTEPGDEEIIRLDFSGEADAILDYAFPAGSAGSGTGFGTGTGQGASSGDPPDLAPIRDLRSRRYFATPRGLESVKFLLCVARANLIAKARSVRIDFTVPLEDALAITCRHSAAITDPRIPGGGASGKVMGYAFSLDGDTGEAVCRITIGCMVGRGGSVTVPNGVNDYVNDDYSGSDYFFRSNDGISVTSDLYFENFSNTLPNDDGTVLDNLNATTACVAVDVFNEYLAQYAGINSVFGLLGMWIDEQEVATAINQLYTEISVEMVELSDGPFETNINLVTSQLEILQSINLEAT